jgi:Protein of unknown function (DUF3592)
MPTTRSISKQGSNAFGTGCGAVIMTIFGLLFGVVGFGMVYAFGIRTAALYVRAQSWQPAQCEITSSQVESHGNTSRVAMKYVYVWNDRTYVGTRYDFTIGSDNVNDAAKHAAVAANQVGMTVPCFVNPGDPTEAVIDRTWKWGYLFGLAIGVPFALVPVLIFGALIYARRSARRQQAATMVTSGSGMAPAAFVDPMFGGGGSMSTATTFASGGPVVLKPESTRLGALFGMIFLCLFWNGLVGVFTFMEFSGNIRGGAGWFLPLFLIPFQLIGVGLVYGVIRSALALLNPKPILTLGSASVPVGGSLTLQWQMQGSAGRLQNLKIVLNGREEARYRRGTDHYTDKHTFFEAPILETTEPSRIERGMATVTIPANTMHSFAATDNKIIWSLKVTGGISMFPDIDETFDLVVRPR